MPNGRFPRSLDEAFNDAVSANPFHGFKMKDTPSKPLSNRNTWGGVLLALTIGLVGAWFLLVGLSK